MINVQAIKDPVISFAERMRKSLKSELFSLNEVYFYATIYLLYVLG